MWGSTASRTAKKGRRNAGPDNDQRPPFPQQIGRDVYSQRHGKDVGAVPSQDVLRKISFPRVDRSKGSGSHDDRVQERDVRSDSRHGGGRRRPAAAVLRGTAEVIEDPAGHIAGELVWRKEGVEFTGRGAGEDIGANDGYSFPEPAGGRGAASETGSRRREAMVFDFGDRKQAVVAAVSRRKQD